MAHVLGVFKVEDFEKWKAGFASPEGVAMRKSGGMRSYRLFRTDGDPNKLVILSEFDDLDTARKFMQSDELRAAHQQSGAVGELVAQFLEEVEELSL